MLSLGRHTKLDGGKSTRQVFSVSGVYFWTLAVCTTTQSLRSILFLDFNSFLLQYSHQICVDSMLRCLLFLAIAISPIFKTTRAQGCEPHAVSLPFKGQRLANQAEARGLLLSIGTPKQDVSVVLCA